MFKRLGIRQRWAYALLDDALAAWLRDAPPSGNTVTLARYEHVLRQVLSGEDLTHLGQHDLPRVRNWIECCWTGRGSRNLAFSAVRAFLIWAHVQGAGHRSLTPTAICTAFSMEPRVPPSAIPPTALDLPDLRVALSHFPLRTRALVGLQVACGWRADVLVALRLTDVQLAARGVCLHIGDTERELVGPTISEVRAYVKTRLRETRGATNPPLFEGCAGQAISVSYARKLLHQVALALGYTGSLLVAIRAQAGGVGGW